MGLGQMLLQDTPTTVSVCNLLLGRLFVQSTIRLFESLFFAIFWPLSFLMAGTAMEGGGQWEER